MKFNDYKGEEAVILMADLLEIITNISTDPDVVAALKDKEMKNARKVAIILKAHSHEVTLILARVAQIPIEEFDWGVVRITKELLDLLGNEDFVAFFLGASRTSSKTSSGDATEPTEETVR